jgi:hypothetical protein
LKYHDTRSPKPNHSLNTDNYNMAPSTTKAWTVQGQNGFDSLTFNEQAKVPEIGDKDVLVKGMYNPLSGYSPQC